MEAEPSIWSIAEAYERYIGRWSRPVGGELVEWLGLPANLRWLDVGCGTGALSRAIAAASSPSLVHGIDSSEGFVALARERADDPGTRRFSTGDALALPVDDESYDVAVSGLRRAIRPGGTVAVYVWDYAEGMELIRRFWDAAIAIDPLASVLDEGRRFPICEPGALADLLRDAGLHDVETRSIVVPTVFSDFDDYWEPFLAGQGPAPAYAAALADGDRAELRERLRASVPAGADGSISLRARAFAVHGRR